MTKKNLDDKLVAFIGNPNVGKSTIFNLITGMRQHTGNWTGKTVESAFGKYYFNDEEFTLVDLPGTYSLNTLSKEEDVTKNFLLYNNPLVTVVVVDAMFILKNLNLVLQTTEIRNNVILCINMIDEAEKNGITINDEILEDELGVKVVKVCAKNNTGIDKLKKEIYDMAVENKVLSKKIKYSEKMEESIKNIRNNLKKNINYNKLYEDYNLNDRYISINLLKNSNTFKHINENLNINLENKSLTYIINDERNKYDNLSYEIKKRFLLEAKRIYIKSVTINNKNYINKTYKYDKILTSKIYGIPIMILLFLCIFWITIKGANYPSELLSHILSSFEPHIYNFLKFIHIPISIVNPIVYGIYRTLSWVISVMLPPMAIFFPLFTLLEESGFLPRLAFNLDKLFEKAETSGKQALTMCMGFGCNACGVVGARIINTKRERLLAIITNALVPCNGRFPTLITLIAIFFTTNSITSSILLTIFILISIIVTIEITKILSKTILKGNNSFFTLEMPPYRKPNVLKVITKSIFDKTFSILKRAILISSIMGLIIWILSNTYINGLSIVKHISIMLDPIAKIFGMDGVILMSFILGIPANEIVIPTAIMTYMNESSLTSLDIASLKTLLINNGWTIKTALSTIIFTLFHFPCGTTLLTIKKETSSIKWMIISFILPTIIGLTLCFIINLLFTII